MGVICVEQIVNMGNSNESEPPVELIEREIIFQGTRIRPKICPQIDLKITDTKHGLNSTNNSSSHAKLVQAHILVVVVVLAK